MVEDRVGRRNRPPDRIVPDGCPELIVHLGSPFSRRRGRSWRRQPKSPVERYPGMEQDAHGIWSSPNGAKVAWFKDPDGNTLSIGQQ